MAKDDGLVLARVDLLDGGVRLEPVLEAQAVLFGRLVVLAELIGPRDELEARLVGDRYGSTDQNGRSNRASHLKLLNQFII